MHDLQNITQLECKFYHQEFFECSVCLFQEDAFYELICSKRL